MTGMADRQVSYDLAHYVRPLRRRWGFVLLGLLLGVAGGLGTGRMVHPSYTSTASVLVNPTGVDPTADTSSSTGRTQSQINLDTEAQLVRSGPVAERARTLMHSADTLENIVRRVTVTVPANTTVLQVSFTAKVADRARQGAHAFAQAYLDNRSTSAEAYLKSQTDTIRSQISSLSKLLQQEAAIAASQPANSPDRAYAQAQVNSYTAQITALASKLNGLTTTIVTPGRIIADAQLPSGPSSPTRLLLLVSCVMLGLLLGVIAAFMRERTDPRIRDTTALDELGLPVLASIPGARNEIDVVAPTTAVTRAFQRLSNVVLANCGPNGGAVMVAGISADQTDRGVAAHLATALKRLGSTVVLVRADPRGTTTARLHMSGYGAAEPIDPVTAEERRNAAERRVFVADLRAADRDGLDVAAVQKVLTKMKESADFVIIEAPPTSVEPMTQTLAASCDGIIFVVETGTTSAADVADAVRQVDLMHGRVLGAVLTGRGRQPAPRSGRSEALPPRRTNDHHNDAALQPAEAADGVS
jgi:capsular polysaccharide biosynthesis protein